MKDSWHSLTQFTQARIAQGRVGSSLPTTALLDFQLAHASARDAVHQAWDVESFAQQCASLSLPVFCLNTNVQNRTEYLQRPDKGRQLAPESQAYLKAQVLPAMDILLIISNGLSSTALDQHGWPMVSVLVKSYQMAGFRVGPICLVPNARVALADEIGFLLQAQQTVILLGERPGLSAADSLGAYLTYAPNQTNTDAERNCLSNIRPPEGLGYRDAAAKLLYLSSQASINQYSGVALKDDMTAEMLAHWLSLCVAG